MENLPSDIIRKIQLFIPFTKSKIKWCHRCGEINNTHLCPQKYCSRCCEMDCIDNGHCIIDKTKAPPFTFEQIDYTIQHLRYLEQI